MGFLSFLLFYHISAGNFFLDPHCKLGIKTDVAILVDTLPLISHIAGSAVFPVINRSPRCGTCRDQLQNEKAENLVQKAGKKSLFKVLIEKAFSFLPQSLLICHSIFRLPFNDILSKEKRKIVN